MAGPTQSSSAKGPRAVLPTQLPWLLSQSLLTKIQISPPKIPSPPLGVCPELGRYLQPSPPEPLGEKLPLSPPAPNRNLH